ncbi:MAG: hypothetical protein ABI704_01570 [Kofleriaceae bacterium]
MSATDLRLLKPPIGVHASCPPAPDFSTWTVAPRVYAGLAGNSIHPTFLGDQHVAFGYQGALYEGDLDGAPVPIVGLDDMAGAELMSAAAAPGGDVFWYVRYANLGGGLYYAVRDGDHWVPHGADFPNVAYSIEPGTAAYYGSEVRMVISLQASMSSTFVLYELSSPDGVTWTNLGPLPFAAPAGTNFFDPALSVDGCVLVYAVENVGIEVALRGDDGTFEPPALFPHTEPYMDVAQPTLSPDESMVWFGTTDEGLFQATP